MEFKMSVRKSKEETAEWSGLFLNDLKTKQDSLVFVKRMMAVAVSSITYLRGIFPEEAYRSRYLEDLCIKLLRETCNNPGASKVVKWMMGCFDALERQYLEIVFIGVYTNPDVPTHIVESYQFKFRYTEKGPEMDIFRNNESGLQVSLDDTKKASLLLVRKLYLLMQNLSALPSNVYLTMNLYYYDNSFKEGECDRLWFEGIPVHFKVGEVQTAFHTLRLRITAEQGRMEQLRGNHLRETEQDSQREMMNDHCKKMNDEQDLPSEDESAQFKKPRRPKVAKKNAASKPVVKKRTRRQ
ncbi:zebrafish testis-expressed 38 isoform X2 [Parambassis ranga]|uniref:Zebrafish testis-expressed 38 isoform X2 n=1 Tax=Parambassis ranga TaxID=210632 RepID=A0A6P7K2E6_9TELE|nr:HORMA domain-containing protein 1-like isoform X2 [Parambassis ranga]